MAIDIKLNTDADLDGVDKLADGLDQAADAADDLDKKDTKKLDKSLDQAADAADDTTDALKDATTAAGKLGDESKSVKKIDTAADDAADTIDRDLTQALRDAATQADQTGQRTSDAFKKGYGEATVHAQKMSEAQEEVASELAQNWGSTMSTFDGSVESAVQIAADSFGGLAGSMAIGGAVGSLILGAAAGLTSMIVQKWQESSDQISAANAQMYQEMLENADAYYSNEQIVSRFHSQISGNTDDDPTLLSGDTFAKIVESTGLTKQQVAIAAADPATHGSDVTNALAVAQQSQQKKWDSYQGSGIDEGTAQKLQDEADALQETSDAWSTYSGDVTGASQSIKDNNAFLQENGYLAESTGEAARELASAQADSADAIDETTQAIEDNNEAAGNAADAATDNNAALADLVDTLVSEQSALADTGAATGDVTDLQRSQAEQFVKTADAAGYGRDEALDLAVKLGLIPDSVATEMKTEGFKDAELKSQTTRSEFDKIPPAIQTRIDLTAPTAADRERITRSIELGMRAVSVAVNLVRGRNEIS